MERREFIGAAAAALFAGVTVQILGCDSTNSPPAGLPEGAIAAYTDRVNDHVHDGYISKAELEAAADGTKVTVTGGGHEHSITLTSAEVLSIKAKQHVMKPSTAYVSSYGSHFHQIMFN